MTRERHAPERLKKGYIISAHVHHKEEKEKERELDEAHITLTRYLTLIAKKNIGKRSIRKQSIFSTVCCSEIVTQHANLTVLVQDENTFIPK